MSAVDPWHCRHPQLSAPRARRVANGTVQHRRQCLACGDAVGTSVARATALQETGRPPEPFDEIFFQEMRTAAKTAREVALEKERDEWWAWYNLYLNSSEWRRRRNLVLRRANGICEGCLLPPAAHVHHKTYEHVGRELLFELVALCEDCHDLAHAENPTGMPFAVLFADVQR